MLRSTIQSYSSQGVVLPRRSALCKRRLATKKEDTCGQLFAEEPSLASQPLAWYSRKLDTHPLLTKAVTSCLIAQSGDLFSQYVEQRRSNTITFKWDMVRTARIGLLGFALVAPVVHYWYGSLARFFPGSTASVVAKRVFWDQAFFSPLFLPTWLTSLWMLEGQSVSDISDMLCAEVPTALIANWVVWIPAQIVNFRYAPVKFQVLFSNVVALGWNAYLSFTAHEAEANVEKARQKEADLTV